MRSSILALALSTPICFVTMQIPPQPKQLSSPCLFRGRTRPKTTYPSGIEDLFIKQVPKQLYRSDNASKHVVRFPNGSNLFFGHIKTDADLLQYQEKTSVRSSLPI